MDPLEQTQEIPDVPEGTYRVITQRLMYPILERAPDLSERYPSVHIDMTRRQAE